jgi:hypothetical protein
MSPKKGTAAYRAHEAGRYFFSQGKEITECPYTTRQQISLKHWFETGYNELKQLLTHG